MRFPSNHHWLLLALLTAWSLFLQDGSADDGSAAVGVDVSASESSHTARQLVTFERHVQPLLTRFGCNSGPCHGKSRGQNGFALSLLGFDSDLDHDALLRQARGRRISFAAPQQSLLLQKALGQVPHGGGIRFAVDSKPHRLIRDWIATGARRTPASAPQLLGISVEPPDVRLAPEGSSQLIVRAEYSDGSREAVTDVTTYQSNDAAIASINAHGLIQAGPVPGETALMARYRSHIAVCRVAIPLPGDALPEQYDQLPQGHPIDQLVWKKLRLLGLLPSAPAGDAVFLRRAYLRIIGRLPEPNESRAFLADTSDDKRQRLVDQLLQRPEYADYWANKWADLLRPNPYRVGIKAVWNLDAWLRQAFRENLPYDQFARRLITAQGSTWHNGATVLFRDRPSTVEIASSVSQIFLGVRLECAKCHHHPFEIWSQDDFYGFAAFFSRVGHHGGLSPPISGGEELIYTARKGTLKHGRTQRAVNPKPLGGAPVLIDDDADPRQTLVDWMVDPSNPYFAQVMANRIWAEIMGRGIVEPVDDIRATNPATNQPLLDFLAQDFRDSGYDIKQLIRTIATSHVFQLSSEPRVRNVADRNNYSRYYRQRLRAEVLLDAVNDVLDTEERFPAMPPGSRATQLWTHRSRSQFLDTFGRPDPNQDPPCDRSSDSTTPQILHLMNSPELNRKLTEDSSRTAQLAASDLSPEQIVEEVYLRLFCRVPSPSELASATTGLQQAANRREAIEDLFWALLNTPEFLFVR